MKSFRTLFSASLFVLFCAAAALAQSIQTDYDRNYNLAKLNTYGFYEQERGPEDPLTASPINNRRIHDALDSQLRANGFTPNAQPDFMIAYFVKTKKGLDIEDNRFGPWQRRGSINVEQVTEGTLIVIFVDTTTKQEVWRGFASGIITPKNLDKDVNKAVAKLVQTFKKNQAGKK
jgi:hypothetical protein